ncbi:putative secreted protein (Por secretion system target) [Lutibacter sp. Hel_I_33_5]|uniref:T9SS type A sorting domain-containing protein n=1 Tax=Lutibacter sp. Hel_I_33_5 TaxID=1566289 RepID=UPI00119F797E|nr:T9SS type A sorting domain-containing protein [Lutibacter sp. Hel_I_33_5]TVZ55388.1 putative secreted protein (Por secretion system target) [Lutibacter sp. Hel_I_33_5]
MIKKISISIFFSLLFISVSTAQLLEVGDPGVTFDQTKLDTNWPQMDRWSKAGVEGGIPFISSLEKGATVTEFTSAGIQAAIESCPVGKYVYLPNGTYNITTRVNMRTGKSLVGESKEGVICTINMSGDKGFDFWNRQNTGISNMTVIGGWGEPKYKWMQNADNDVNNQLPTNDNHSIVIQGGSKNCWIDNVDIINSAKHPLVIKASHVTIRGCNIKGVHNKGGGWNGYFHIGGSDNLIYNNSVTQLRHISSQEPDTKYNVIYKNNFNQEFSFHKDDGGDNLIEQNNITLPADMPNSSPNYYAIMGPWSTQHPISRKPNFVYKNTCKELNHNGATPWSDDSKIYNGPFEQSPSNPYTNFKDMGTNMVPKGGTLYPVKNTTASINDVTFDKISVYPTIVDKEITIDFKSTIEKRKISLLNINGQLILNKNVENSQKVTIDLKNHSLSKGIYFLRISNQNSVKTFKLIKR